MTLCCSAADRVYSLSHHLAGGGYTSSADRRIKGNRRSRQQSQFIEDTVEPSYLPGINSLFIICIRIIRNNSLVGGHTRAEGRTPDTMSITLYCTWWPSVLTTRPHGQVKQLNGSRCIFGTEAILSLSFNMEFGYLQK